jgi:hypothetical protein
MTKPSLRLAVVLMALASPLLLAQQASSPAAAVKAPAFKAHVLTVSELNALVAKPDQLLFLDVRRPDEVTSIGGFPVYLSVQLADLEKSLAWIPKDRTARSSPFPTTLRAPAGPPTCCPARVSRWPARLALKATRKTEGRLPTSRRPQSPDPRLRRGVILAKEPRI